MWQPAAGLLGLGIQLLLRVQLIVLEATCSCSLNANSRPVCWNTSHNVLRGTPISTTRLCGCIADSLLSCRLLPRHISDLPLAHPANARKALAQVIYIDQHGEAKPAAGDTVVGELSSTLICQTAPASKLPIWRQMTVCVSKCVTQLA